MWGSLVDQSFRRLRGEAQTYTSPPMNQAGWSADAWTGKPNKLLDDLHELTRRRFLIWIQIVHQPEHVSGIFFDRGILRQIVYVRVLSNANRADLVGLSQRELVVLEPTKCLHSG